ncbi:hypothetical protein VNO78_15246 [Psophocarpus tetragonolobus]|uniref:Uncharacterized protein n=1 Tax=Psophocarpus tetragonolobus TaxID=3891 RepID=A0AAN9SEA8_PSOTE
MKNMESNTPYASSLSPSRHFGILNFMFLFIDGKGILPSSRLKLEGLSLSAGISLAVKIYLFSIQQLASNY